MDSEVRHCIVDDDAGRGYRQRAFWASVVLLLAATLILGAIWLQTSRIDEFVDSRLPVAPSDVKAAVEEGNKDLKRKLEQIDRKLDVKTADRFYKAWFDSFLKNNPELNPPDDWE